MIIVYSKAQEVRTMTWYAWLAIGAGAAAIYKVATSSRGRFKLFGLEFYWG